MQVKTTLFNSYLSVFEPGRHGMPVDSGGEAAQGLCSVSAAKEPRGHGSDKDSQEPCKAAAA